ncbi:hypothetical protein M23134_04705 [Microscilla marina ATCC 23134]|uniref:Uncharacterized protein n=1 Tax=Microscilla marina ATCC 23134 TaxID=313606 RepID=A1ZRC7_MICM2|nr:hypothetical protein M23134_04705 [Microscilla marina ATCC 23134]
MKIVEKSSAGKEKSLDAKNLIPVNPSLFLNICLFNRTGISNNQV